MTNKIEKIIINKYINEGYVVNKILDSSYLLLKEGIATLIYIFDDHQYEELNDTNKILDFFKSNECHIRILFTRPRVSETIKERLLSESILVVDYEQVSTTIKE